MPAQRKVFRIEQMAGAAGLQQQEILNELKALRDLIERRAQAAPDIDPGTVAASGRRQLKDETDTVHGAISRTKQGIATLHAGAFDGVGTAVVTRELDALAESAERATKEILNAAEEIEDAANTLSARLKQEQEEALAQDIQDHVTRIFEACSFQDLSGQRITKVLATLKFVEDNITRMIEIWGGIEAFKEYAPAAKVARDKVRGLVHGAKLESERDHASQADIDAMFAPN